MSMKKHNLSRVRATFVRLLPWFVAIGVISGAPSRALSQQGLHVVPSPSINNSSLSGTAAIADNDIWAVGQISGSGGSNNVTLAEHFNGSIWNVVPTPAVTGGVFYAVDGAASNDVWAVGSQAAGSSITALIEHWNGASWSVVSSPRVGHGAFLSAITAVSSSDVWAAGSRRGEHPDELEAIVHWDGSSWSIVPTVNPFPANHLSSRFNGIAAVSANNIWAIGGGFTEHWNGTSWSLLSTPSGVNLVGITALSDGTVVAVGHSNGSAVILQN
jgi:hypothetical protein